MGFGSKIKRKKKKEAVESLTMQTEKIPQRLFAAAAATVENNREEAARET